MFFCTFVSPLKPQFLIAVHLKREQVMLQPFRVVMVIIPKSVNGMAQYDANMSKPRKRSQVKCLLSEPNSVLFGWLPTKHEQQGQTSTFQRLPLCF